MRTHNEIQSELNTINDYLLKGIPDGDISLMMQTLSTLVTYLASSAALLAEAGFLYNQAKKKAYLTLKSSSEANREYYSPMLAKDYIASSCADECYLKDLSDRLNSALIHTIDSCRTNISAEKSMMSNLK